jgi:hypothetical protein
MAPIHRDLGAHLHRGMEPWQVMASFMGKATSPTGGRDGTLHYGRLDLGVYNLPSHIPANFPVATGMAFAAKYRGEDRVSLAFCGDGSTSRADFHESLNMAGALKLPCIFVIENNQFAYSTPVSMQTASHDFAGKARGIRIPRCEGGWHERARGLRRRAARVLRRGDRSGARRGWRQCHIRVRRFGVHRGGWRLTSWGRGFVLQSTAVVATDAPERYAKQLLAHLGRKNTVETVDGERHSGRLVFAYGTGTVRPEDNHLVLEAATEDPDSLAHVEDVLGRHLERFGAKRELVVTRQRRSADSAGSADGIGG